MSYFLFIIIFYSFFHWYFQNVLVPGMLASKKLKLLDLEQRVESLKSRNTISYSLYLGFKLLFRTSESIIDSPNGIDIYAFENRSKAEIEEDPASIKDMSAWARKTQNPEVSMILKDWEKCMHEAYKVSFYAWYAYLFPAVIIDKLFRLANQRYFHSWLINMQPYKNITSSL